MTIIENIKDFCKRKQTLVIILLVLIFATLTVGESVTVNCTYINSVETCDYVFDKVPSKSLFALVLLVVLWGVLTVYAVKLFAVVKEFVKKRPIVSFLVVVFLAGMFPFPIRCTETIWYEGGAEAPIGVPQLFNDTPRQLGKCYFVLTKEFWMPEKPTIGGNIGPLAAIFVEMLNSNYSKHL